MTQHHIRSGRAAAVLLAAGALAVAGCSAAPAKTATGPPAPTPLFPVGAGNTWTYAVTVPGATAAAGTTRMTTVRDVSGSRDVTVLMQTGLGPARKVTYEFHHDGSVSIPVTQFADGALAGGSVTWPPAAQLASGKADTATVMLTARIDGKVERLPARVTIQGEGTQPVTVPAGSYHAQLISEALRVTVQGAVAQFTVDTWAAPGVGPVKIVVSGATTGSVAPATDELQSFHQG